MPVIAIVNRKGGSGKSTLATHLAAYCARQGIPVMLGDVDRQQSTRAWLARREARGASAGLAIHGWAQDPRRVLRPPPGIQHVVLDTPGGLRDTDLARVVMYADAILMPVCQSLFDRESAAACHAELMTLPRVSSGRCRVAAVGMRLDSRTKADEELRRWAEEHDIRFIGAIREAQAYVRGLERGLTMFDAPPAQAQRDLEQWQPILDWLGPLLEPASEPEVAVAPSPPLATRPPAVAVAPRVAPVPEDASARFQPVASMFVRLDESAPPRGWGRWLRWLPTAVLGRR